jgi:hypothetical protein
MPSMRTVRFLVVAFVWAASLLGVGLWAQGGSGANAQAIPIPGMQTGDPIGPVITGENLGFQRIAAPPDKDGRVTGRWVVKAPNGQWVETIPAVRVML